MDVEVVIARVKQILVEEFELDEEAIHPGADLRDDLKLDSLDGMDLVVTIEKEFDFRVDEKRMMTMRTVGEVYDYIREVVTTREAPAPAAEQSAPADRV